MIIWGTKRVEKKLGRVADFCSMCRNVRCFGLRKISMVGHIYFVGLGRGETVGHFAACETCGFEKQADPTSYAAIAKTRSKSDVRLLVQETFPNITQAYADRLSLEKQLRSSPGSIDPEMREELIHEVLQNAAPTVEERYAAGIHFDAPSGLAFLAALVGPVMVFALAGETSEGGASIASSFALSVFGVGMVATIYYLATANRRWMYRRVLPMLTRGFRELRPTEAELDELLKRFRVADFKIGKKLKSRVVCDALQEGRTVVPA